MNSMGPFKNHVQYSIIKTCTFIMNNSGIQFLINSLKSVLIKLTKFDSVFAIDLNDFRHNDEFNICKKNGIFIYKFITTTRKSS